MQLSKRLYAVAKLAAGGKCLADVGTDHGYVPIYLVEETGLSHAIAMDINRGPLERAKENIRIHGLEERIETRLSDGVAGLQPDEADTVVIAGMGGALTADILRKGREVLAAVETLVLQPQSEIFQVRRFLQENGYRIIEEDMELDEGKYYPMMKVRHGLQPQWEDYEYKYGKYLIADRHPVLKEFLEKEYHTYNMIHAGLKNKQGEHILRRLHEVEEEIRMINRAKEAMR